MINPVCLNAGLGFYFLVFQGAWICNKEEETRRKSGFKFLFQLNDMWKALGLLCFLLAVCSCLSRMKKTETFNLTKRFCGLLLIFSYLRCSRVFAIHRFTGRSFMFLRYMVLESLSLSLSLSLSHTFLISKFMLLKRYFHLCINIFF